MPSLARGDEQSLRTAELQKGGGSGVSPERGAGAAALRREATLPQAPYLDMVAL